MKGRIKELIRSFGYEIRKSGVHPDEGKLPVDMQDGKFPELFEKANPYSFTGAEPLYHLYQSVRYLETAAVQGAFVECGVWKGGSAMMMAYALNKDHREREIWLYDTFDGMSEPGSEDVDFRGDSAANLLKEQPKDPEQKNIWCVSALEEVRKNMQSTGFPEEKTRYVKGKVEDTIPAEIPEKIALLRLDTDWYGSTHHELKHLYPRLVKGGVLIIDDYGHWKGARKAVDEYFLSNNIPMLLHRIDYSVRAGIKP